MTMLNAAVLHLREEFMLTTDSASAIATFLDGDHCFNSLQGLLEGVPVIN